MLLKTYKIELISPVLLAKMGRTSWSCELEVDGARHTAWQEFCKRNIPPTRADRNYHVIDDYTITMIDHRECCVRHEPR